jgi:PAS domain S-box-containing protein
MAPLAPTPASFKQALLRATLLPALVMVSLAALLLWQVAYLVRETGRVEHTDRVISYATELQKLFLDMETGVRGYLITGTASFLDPHDRASDEMPAMLGRLRELVSDNPEQVTRLREIEANQATWRDLASAARELKDTGGDYVAFIGTEAPRREMDAIRAKLDAFVHTEERLRAERATAAQVATRTVFVSSAGLTILLGLVLGVLSRRQLLGVSRSYEKALDDRANAEEKLRRLNEDLERRVTERTVELETANARLSAESAARRVALEDARRYAEEVSDLYNHAPCGYHSLNRDGAIVQINDTELGWLGYAREEIVGKRRFADLLVPEDVATFREQFPLFKERGWVRDLEFDLVRKDGTRLPVLINATAIRDVNGAYVASRSSVFDMTDRKVAELAVQQAEERYRALVEAASQFVWRTDGEGINSDDTTWWRDFTGFELDGWSWLECLHPDDRDAVERAWRHALETKTNFHVEYRLRRHDGEYLHFTARGVPIWEKDGELREWIGTLTDVTEHRRDERAIAELNIALEQRVHELKSLNDELEAFSYSVSHDLRAPLRSIDGFSRILLEDFGPALADDARDYLELVRTNAQHMGRLIDDLLAFSRLSRAPLRMQTVDMTALARRVLDDVRPEWGDRNVDASVRDLPPCQGDPTLIRQVLANLLLNAIKYSRDVEHARIEVGGSAAENGEGTYFVSDNGVGFDMRYAHKLFGVFQRLHRAEDYEGTGVGLAIVQRIVARHGGRAWAEGEVGKGATFYFSLPLEGHHADEFAR